MARKAAQLLAVLWLVSFPARAAPPAIEVEVEGLSGELREAVLSNLSIQREAQRGDPVSEARVTYLHQRAAAEIRLALQPFGYYQPQITERLIRRDRTWRASYAVQTGAPVRVGTVDLQIQGPGSNARVFRDWKERFPLRPGDVLRHLAYEDAKRELLRLAEEQGYLEASLIAHEIRVDVGAGRADIVLGLQTGPRYAFGPVRFEQTALREAFLRRFLPFEAGDPYDEEALLRLQRALIDSDYFEQVDVIPRLDAVRDRQVPVDVRLALRPRNRYTAGIGYGTDTGPRLTAGVERRWANAMGHRLGAEATVSGIGAAVSTRYRIPLEQPTTDFLGFVAGWDREETGVATRDIADVGASITRQIGKWTRSLGLNYQQEDFEVADTRDTSRLVIPSVAWQRVAARTRFFPESGWRVTAGVKGAAKTLGSTASLLQGQLSYKNIWSVWGGRFLMRVDAGASETEEFDELPVSLRFFAGGDQSVRGYDYKSLGPRNADGEVTGGRYLLVGSVEYDHYFTDRFGWAVFVDTGNAFNNLNDYVLERGIGLGLRWKLPFGPLRLDVANAATEPGRPWRLHLTVGPDL